MFTEPCIVISCTFCILNIFVSYDCSATCWNKREELAFRLLNHSVEINKRMQMWCHLFKMQPWLQSGALLPPCTAVLTLCSDTTDEVKNISYFPVKSGDSEPVHVGLSLGPTAANLYVFSRWPAALTVAVSTITSEFLFAKLVVSTLLM